jgi:hypothetical protein
MRDFFGVLIVRFVHWWDRNEEDAQETCNETLHLVSHHGEHAAYALPWVLAVGESIAVALVTATMFVVGNLSAAAGVMYVAVTLYQIRLYGFRSWLHWGAGTGVEGDIRRVVHRIDRDVADEVRKIEVDMGHVFHPDYNTD